MQMLKMNERNFSNFREQTKVEYAKKRAVDLGLSFEDSLIKAEEEISLHVLGRNKVARKLYESIGFEETSIYMAKKI